MAQHAQTHQEGIALLFHLWDYRKKLLHKSEDFTLEQFQKHLRIEEESRKRENKVTILVESNVHYVDGSGSQSKNPALQQRYPSTQLIKDHETIISNSTKFKLGFFGPANSTSLYVGILYNIPVQTAIWVAKRDKPLSDTFGTVAISGDAISWYWMDSNNSHLVIKCFEFCSKFKCTTIG
ncbi:hypothetical protein RJ639_042650 [Escallonia herrerae]|uniref:Uncharacterized protein n=1 Tax=Escallonia herrerae TaxID=1293975 RepID=A0AA89B577_9ASTE|nr:hypothetical protein RJ639_042650 [Escallonia herrerae]